jgi:uncharacterized protein (TIGR03790 family)
MRVPLVSALLLLCAALLMPSRSLGLDHRQLALVVNTLDPLSVAIGEYYAARRAIVFSNVIRVAFDPAATLTREEFEEIKKEVDARTLPHIQAYALAWTQPWRVECMSITAAFAFGFDPAFCAQGCEGTQPSRYFGSPSRRPFRDLGIRPTMAIAAASLAQAKALIDRGVAADGTQPEGTAYLVSTSDTARGVRTPLYPSVQRVAKGRIRIAELKQEALMHRTDVLVYFIGTARAEALHTLRFRPGAVADHVTSFGGILTGDAGGQMSALRWLEAGATGSYGTVVEPCNLAPKFPHPGVLVAHYLAGERLIEAYWKSVRMPGQGVFVGEPLAAPFLPRGGM